jgi:DNA-binding CsgD family transcriptional regulator
VYPVFNFHIFPQRRLSPRERQVLNRLLQGDSEKQVAAKLGISSHTVHVYVRTLHIAFNVASRGELLALFIPAAVRESICLPPN